MINSKELYRELKPDLEKVAGFLFDFAEQQILKRGNFLPFAAYLNDDRGVIPFVGPSLEEGFANSVEILPLLFEGLKGVAREGNILEIAVCENVKLSLEGNKQIDAIKVTIEDRRGLTVAFYITFSKNTMGEWEFGKMFVKAAESEFKVLT